MPGGKRGKGRERGPMLVDSILIVEMREFPLHINPFDSKDLISNSPYCLPHDCYNVNSRNLVLDQRIIPN